MAAKMTARNRSRTMSANTHDLLRELVPLVTCKPGWRFWLDDDDEGFRLVILVPGPDSWDPEDTFNVRHYFPVPMTTWNEKTWRRWIFDCCLDVEKHEMGEWFEIKGVRPFLPSHGPGENPYTIREYRPEIDARVTQDGSIRKEGPHPS